jgi:hypothetical protein
MYQPVDRCKLYVNVLEFLPLLQLFRFVITYVWIDTRTISYEDT